MDRGAYGSGQMRGVPCRGRARQPDGHGGAFGLHAVWRDAHDRHAGRRARLSAVSSQQKGRAAHGKRKAHAAAAARGRARAPQRRAAQRGDRRRVKGLADDRLLLQHFGPVDARDPDGVPRPLSGRDRAHAGGRQPRDGALAERALGRLLLRRADARRQVRLAAGLSRRIGRVAAARTRAGRGGCLSAYALAERAVHPHLAQSRHRSGPPARAARPAPADLLYDARRLHDLQHGRGGAWRQLQPAAHLA